MSDLLSRHEAASSVALSAPADGLPFRRDDGAPFPTAGAALLLLLIGLAAWAWWTAARRGPGPAGPAGLASALARVWKIVPGQDRPPRLVGSTRLGSGAFLHVVEWRGTEVLVAVNGSSQPVVLGRQPADGVLNSAGAT